MSKVANRIVKALSIPSSDVYEIGHCIVAVNPVWQGAIQQWIDTNGQKWYKNWFEKGYMASKVFTGPADIDFTWCLHRDFLTSAPATLAQQSVRFKPIGLGQGASNSDAFRTKAKGVFVASTAGRFAQTPNYYPGQTFIFPETLSVVGVQQQFCGLPFGPDYDVSVPMRPEGLAALSTEPAGSYLMGGSCVANAVDSPILNMLLIEGPSTFDYGEVCPQYEFFLVMNNTIRQDMLTASIREPSLKLRSDSVELENDPTGGLGYLRMYTKSSVNPFDFIPAFRPYAEEVFESDQTVEGVSMSSIRSVWDKEAVFVGGFAGDPGVRTSFPVGVTDDDEAEALAVADLEALVFTIKASDVIYVTATETDGTHIAARLTSELAEIVIKRQSVRGTTLTVNVDANEAPDGDNVAMQATYAKLMAARSAQSVVGAAQKELRKHGQSDQVGYSTLVAAAKLMSYDQRLIASTLLIPGMVYDNATAALIKG